MGLFQRIGDIVSANLNEMVEKFEDPEMMLRQAAREMEEAITQARLETARAMASGKLVHRSLAEHERQALEWQQRAEHAVTAGDDALARKALARRQEYGKMVAALRDQAAASDEAAGMLRRQLEAMQAKLAEAKRRLATYGARKKAAAVRERVESALAAGPPEPAAFEKFDRLREKVERLEAEAEALRELDAGPAAAAEAPQRPSDIDAELNALKQRLRK